MRIDRSSGSFGPGDVSSNTPSTHPPVAPPRNADGFDAPNAPDPAPAAAPPHPRLPWAATVSRPTLSWIYAGASAVGIGCAVGAVLVNPFIAIGAGVALGAAIALGWTVSRQGTLRNFIMDGYGRPMQDYVGVLERVAPAKRHERLEVAGERYELSLRVLTAFGALDDDAEYQQCVELTQRLVRSRCDFTGMETLLGQATSQQRRAFAAAWEQLNRPAPERSYRFSYWVPGEFAALLQRLDQDARHALLAQALTHPVDAQQYVRALNRLYPADLSRIVKERWWGEDAAAPLSLAERTSVLGEFLDGTSPRPSSLAPPSTAVLGMVARCPAADRHPVVRLYERCRYLGDFGEFVLDVPADQLRVALRALCVLGRDRWSTTAVPLLRAMPSEARLAALVRLDTLPHLQNAPERLCHDLLVLEAPPQRWDFIRDLLRGPRYLATEELQKWLQVWRELPDDAARDLFESQVAAVCKEDRTVTNVTLIPLSRLEPEVRAVLAARCATLPQATRGEDIAWVLGVDDARWNFYAFASELRQRRPFAADVDATETLLRDATADEALAICNAMRTERVRVANVLQDLASWLEAVPPSHRAAVIPVATQILQPNRYGYGYAQTALSVMTPEERAQALMRLVPLYRSDLAEARRRYNLCVTLQLDDDGWQRIYDLLRGPIPADVELRIPTWCDIWQTVRTTEERDLFAAQAASLHDARTADVPLATLRALEELSPEERVRLVQRMSEFNVPQLMQHIAPLLALSDAQWESLRDDVRTLAAWTHPRMSHERLVSEVLRTDATMVRGLCAALRRQPRVAACPWAALRDCMVQLQSVADDEREGITLLTAALYVAQETDDTRPWAYCLAQAGYVAPALRPFVADALMGVDAAQTFWEAPEQGAPFAAWWPEFQRLVWVLQSPQPAASLPPAPAPRGGDAQVWEDAATRQRDIQRLAENPWQADAPRPLLAYAAMQRGATDLAIEVFAVGTADISDLDDVELFGLHMQRRADGDVDAAHELFDEGHLGAVAAAAEVWGGTGPLPGYIHTLVTTTYRDDINGLMGLLERVVIPEPDKAAFRLAVLELFIRPNADILIDGPTTADFECIACRETKPASEAMRLNACSCDSAICYDCSQRAHVAGTDSECATGCHAPLTRQDLERLNMPPEQGRERLERLLRAALGRLPNWTWCATPDCLSGRQTPNANQRIDCGVCHVPREPEPDSPYLIRQLLDGIGASASPNGSGVFRECYHCGSPTEKGPACMHMTCTKCHQEWDFNRGVFVTVNWADEGVPQQSYRPRNDGMLGRQGFYAGIPVGALSREDKALVARRAVEWRERYPLLDPEEAGAAQGARGAVPAVDDAGIALGPGDFPHWDADALPAAAAYWLG